MKHYFSEIIDKLRAGKKVETVFGEPVELSTVTIIPVVKVRCKKGSLEMSSPDRGDAVKEKQPLGYIEIRDEGSRFIPLYDTTGLILIGAIFGIGLYYLSRLIDSRLIKPVIRERKKISLSVASKESLKNALFISGASLGAGAGFILLKNLFKGKGGPGFRIPEQEVSLSEDRRSKTSEDKSRFWNDPEIVEISESLDELET